MESITNVIHNAMFNKQLTCWQKILSLNGDVFPDAIKITLQGADNFYIEFSGSTKVVDTWFDKICTKYINLSQPGTRLLIESCLITANNKAPAQSAFEMWNQGWFYTLKCLQLMSECR